MTFPSGVVRQRAGIRQRLRDLPPGPRGQGHRRRGDRGRQAGVQDVHYLPAGAVKLGSDVHVGYEYDGKTYVGALSHVGGTQCTSCHDPVAQPPHLPDHRRLERHLPRLSRRRQRQSDRRSGVIHTLDYDGDGNTSEPLAAEIDGLAASTLAAMQAVAAAPGALLRAGRSTLTSSRTRTATRAAAPPSRWRRTASPPGRPRSSKAAFNYQLSRTEPGAWAHNFDYMAQLLYDSTADLGGDVSKLRRP